MFYKQFYLKAGIKLIIIIKVEISLSFRYQNKLMLKGSRYGTSIENIKLGLSLL